MTARVLIVEGNEKAASKALEALGAQPYHESYGAQLTRFQPSLALSYAFPADGDADGLPEGVNLTDFDGIALTGSKLNAYDMIPEVTRQIDFAKAAAQSSVPIFGSCWGLQIMTAALGGEVALNKNGIEIGIARHIRLNRAGKDHRIYEGKSTSFDAIAIHTDEVTILPPGAEVLAQNDHSAVQAMVIETGKTDFWGVQYHPEMDLKLMATLFERDRAKLVDQGFARDDEDMDRLICDYRAMSKAPDKALAWRYGLGPDVLDPDMRMAELDNWLKAKVLPRAAARQ